MARNCQGSRRSFSTIAMGQAKEEGLKVEVYWQDADSSSATGFRYSFANEQDKSVRRGYVS